MREIQFRGKSKKDGKWVYGWYVKKNEQHIIYTNEQYEDQSMPPGYVSYKQEYFEVEEKTVGQWTGRVDKNGKRTFEGDIVIIGSDKNHPCILDYSYIDCAFIFITGYGVNHYYLKNNDAYEVIGNIHDNMELLKKEE
jgi:uncharacterized phage protein (TIGR01671 family)